MAGVNVANMLELDDEFLNRVKRAYRYALDVSNDYHGVIWRDINSKKGKIHNALLAEDNDGLRAVFANPEKTNLFIGINLLRPDWRSTAEVADIIARGGYKDGFDWEDFVYVKEARYASDKIISFKPSSVIEIGPGMGLVAWAAYTVGIKDYTTIDLPMGIVAQAWFLGGTLGSDKICLPGEAYLDGQLRMLVAGQCLDRSYELAFNSDSLTEMSFRAALGYLKWIHSHCGYFIAIGKHNNLFTIKDISAKHFICQREQPYPIRAGYTECLLVPRRFPGMLPWHRLAWHMVKLVKNRGFTAIIGFLRRRLWQHNQ